MDWNTLPSPLVQSKLSGKVSFFLDVEPVEGNKEFHIE
ncbi:hypothetical protein [Escherichia phage HK2]